MNEAPTKQAHSPLPGGDPETVLVLAGGNALGAYLAGAFEHLSERGVQPGWIVGTSIGAVTGAILAGNTPEHRVERLREFWQRTELHTRRASPPFGFAKRREIYNGLHVAAGALFGRPSLFGHRFPGFLSLLPWGPDDVALYDHAPLRATLERLVDFDRLNGGETRFSLGTFDMEAGRTVFFDTARDRIGPEHVLASAALAPLFPPIEIGGRLLCDAGYANNMPLDYPFIEPLDRDVVCLAVDLYNPGGSRPTSLSATVERVQDVTFGSHGRRNAEALRREYALRERLEPNGPRVTLVHMVYQAPLHELASKSLDFSPSSIADRWAAGRRDMGHGLGLLADAPRDGRFTYLAVDPVTADPSVEAADVSLRGVGSPV